LSEDAGEFRSPTSPKPTGFEDSLPTAKKHLRVFFIRCPRIPPATMRAGDGMADKLKGGKIRQASLVESSDERGKPDNLDRTVAQAFDSDPKVRQRVAEELGRTDDPRAIFALIELSSDKDEAVKIAAQKSLGQYKEEEKETIVSLEKLFAERKENPKPEEMPAVRQRMMPTLEKLFSHYEPRKRDSVKRKLLPSIEKLFGFSQKQEGGDPLHGLDKIAASPSPTLAQQPQPAQREPERIPRENAANFPFGQKKEAPEPQPQKHDSLEIESEDHELAFVQEGDDGEFEDDEPTPEEQERRGRMSEDKYYSLAYKIATTPGMGKAELKREQNRLLSNFKKEIGLAFKLAEEKAEQDGMANFSNLKPGMKGLNFAEMPIVSISDVGFGTKKKPFVKIKLTDGRKEQALLIPSERAHGIAPQDKIALRGVAVDFLVETSEAVLVVKSKSKVIVIK